MLANRLLAPLNRPPLMHRTAGVSIWLASGLAVLSLSWLLIDHYLPWTTFRQESLAVLAFVLLTVAALAQSNRSTWPRLAWVLGAVSTIPLFQWAAGQIHFLDDAILSSAYLGMWAMCICAAASLGLGAGRRHLVHGLAASLVFTGVVSAGIALSQWLGPLPLDGWIAELPKGARPFANIGQSNHLSTLLLLGFAAALYWYERGVIRGWVAAVCATWLGWGVVMTQSRTGWLTVGVLAIWWLAMRRRANLRLPPLALILGIALFALAVLCQERLYVFWNGPLDWEGAVPLVRLNAGTRWVHWPTLWQALLQSPWVGYGWNQVANAQFGFASLYPATGEWLSQSHNLILDLLIYNGLPLGTLIAGLLVAWVARRVIQCRDSETWCWLLALFVLFTHALVENPLHYAYFLVPAGLIMGIVGATSPTVIRTPRLVAAIPFAFTAAVLTATAVEYVKAEEALRDLRLASFHVGKPPKDLPPPDWLILHGWSAYHRALSMEVRARMPEEDIDALRVLAARYPYPNILSLYAQAALLNDRPEVARLVLIHACKVHKPVVCDAMRVWWSRLGLRHPQARAVPFPAVWE
jgi:O-antigen ligase